MTTSTTATNAATKTSAKKCTATAASASAIGADARRNAAFDATVRNSDVNKSVASSASRAATATNAATDADATVLARLASFASFSATRVAPSSPRITARFSVAPSTSRSLTHVICRSLMSPRANPASQYAK